MDVIQLNTLARQLREIALAASRKQGDAELSVAQLAVIEAVARKPDISVREITGKTGLAQSWVSKIVSEKCDEGVFVLRKDPQDQRRTLVAFSEDAHKMTFTDRGATSINNELRARYPTLSESEVERIIVLLEELHSALS